KKKKDIASDYANGVIFEFLVFNVSYIISIISHIECCWTKTGFLLTRQPLSCYRVLAGLFQSRQALRKHS
ncbi:unnamed protein product, partial [Ixodes hexagonus]